MYKKTYKFRLYSTRKPTIALLYVLSVCRKLYNGTLHDRQVAYEDAHCPVSYYDQQDLLKYMDKNGVHREIEGKIKTCTIRKDGDYWYACFGAEIDEEVEPVVVNTSVGIDVGLTTLATLSDGTEIVHY